MSLYSDLTLLVVTVSEDKKTLHLVASFEIISVPQSEQVYA